MRVSFFSCVLLQKRKSTTRLFSILSTILIFAGFAPSAYADYPLARVTNNTEYTVSGQVQYVSMFCSDDNYTVAPGKTWTASSRGVCLIDDITGSTGGAIGKYGESTSITPYHASPATSYSGFQINAFSGSYRIFSADEWKKVSNTKQGKSPGFYFVNKTAWPLTYSLDQVGCLYHGIIPAGEGEKGVRRVDTGAVWFTLKIAIQPDGIDPVSNWDCVKPVAEIVADVALAAVTGGGTAVAKAGGKVIVKQVAKEAVKAGAKKAIKSAAKKILTNLAKDELGKILSDAGSVELYGQYAGYEWPFRCDNMPEYHIIGGPVPLKDEDGELYLQRGTPFKVTKVNDCGDDMMSGSKRSMESDQSSFSDWPGGAGVRPAETGAPDCVTFYTAINAGGKRLQLCGGNFDELIVKDVSIEFRNKVNSFACNSGVKSVMLLNLREPIKFFDCKGGNIINNDGLFNSATAAVFYRDPARVKAKAKAAAQARAAEETRATAVRAAEQKARSNAEEGAREKADAEINYSNCSLRGSVTSIPDTMYGDIYSNFVNIGSKNIKIYMIDTMGKEVSPMGEGQPNRTLENRGLYPIIHKPESWYIATDDSGECVGMVKPAVYTAMYNFNSDLVIPGEHPAKAVSETFEPGTENVDQSVYENQGGYSQNDQQDDTDYSGQGPGCEYIGQIASPDGGEIVEATFENSSNQSIDLYWIDANGDGNNYQDTGEPVVSIPAQSYQTLRTKIGHYFAGVDGSGYCRGVAEISYSGEIISFPALQ